MQYNAVYGFTLLLAWITEALGNACNHPLLDGSRLTSTSQVSFDRDASKARLNALQAWTAGNSDFGQFLTIDLKAKRNITAIATQGRPFTSEYVVEYRIEYGNNGQDYSEYKDYQGNIKLFKGNRDGNSIQWNRFEVPIIAQFVRINPTRWRDRISMRMELFGCDYVSETMNFDGQSYVSQILMVQPVMSLRDHIRLRLKTNRANAILMYSYGTQGDFFALQLVDNKLVLNIDLGAKNPTAISMGSLLDDNLWHDVVITRFKQEVIFTVDRVVLKKKIKGDFSQLDLNREWFVGGVPNFNQPGLMVAQNFTGCLENLFVNSTNFIAEVRGNEGRSDRFAIRGQVYYSCIDEQVTPVTFKSSESHLILKGFMGVPSINVSVDFRTFTENGLLIYHKFSTDGDIKVFLDKGKIKGELVSADTPLVTLDGFDVTFNDGLWHKVMLIMGVNYVEIRVDYKPSLTKRLLSFKTGSQYLVGGGHYSMPGFTGCMRYINVDGNNLQPANAQRAGDIVLDACQMVDRCNPNPCEHGGVCRQSWNTFDCDCSNTGYTGAVCHTSMFALSCFAYRESQRLWSRTFDVDINIDIDGSGPMTPFPVNCKFYSDNSSETYLDHKNSRTTLVNGFDKPGSFSQDIVYNAGMEQIIELVERAFSCKQRIQYDCFRARLFNTPVPENQPFRPFSWWVSRDNQAMDYWGGSIPGTRKCACGMAGNCDDPKRWCNCDSMKDGWSTDDGDLMQKEFLPVKQLRFGDTGSPLDDKQGRYTLGPLICSGDSYFDNVVTFRLADATINYPSFDMGHSGDIYFEFRTTQVNGVIISSRGPTDYIQIQILNGNQIQFSYFAGNGPMSATVTTSYKLNDNEWHSVLVERNRKEGKVMVDGSLRTIVPEPQGPVRAIHLTSDFVVGATVEYRDGFVGCLRALLLNGRTLDMIGPANRGLYGVIPGCVGKCLSSPCLNNATCLEGYSHYVCDCRWTSFKGPICADEIGVNLRSDYMIKYDFDGTYKSTMAEKIRVAFTTTDQKGMLVGLSSYTGEYFNLMMSNSGHLRLVFDFGFERQEVFYTEQNLANGQTHDVRISRTDNGLKLILQVDNYEPKIWTFPIQDSQDAQFNNIKALYVGRNDTMGRGDGFIGCVSRVEFDDVYALKLLFQEDRPTNIHAFPDTMKEDFCGVEPVTYPPVVAETRPPPTYDPSVIIESERRSSADSTVLGMILAIIFLALVAMAVLIGRYISRHKGEYKTYEDKGARDAPDADTAVVQGTTGHDVSKSKEWFI